MGLVYVTMSDEMTNGEWLAERFEEHRDRLRAIAFRILGSPNDADDAVQEAWLRFSRSDTSEVDNLGGWLNTVISRVCLNMLRARKSRPEPHARVDLPEPPADPAESDPAHEALLADSVGLALLVVLDTLKPAERVAFVLHDVFAIPFDEIAPIVDRSTPATRQLASRARARVQSRDADGRPDRVRQAAVVDAFLAAAREGDFEALIALLDPDVVLWADEQAVKFGAAPETRGVKEVGAFLRHARGATPALLDGAAAAVWVYRGELRVVYRFTTDGARITGVDLIADPDHLRRLDLVVLEESVFAVGAPDIMSVVSDLDPPIRQMIDATNRGDSEDFLAAFADDAVLDDWGRTFTGHDEIAGWNARENIGVNSHIDVTGVERSGDEVRVGVSVSGDGYNGGGAFTFALADDRIARMVITG
jgi:RNA polymerase sigma factor (sigma-70 family)